MDVRDLENVRKQLVYETKYHASYYDDNIDAHMRLALDACEEKLYGAEITAKKYKNAISYFKERADRIRATIKYYDRPMSEDLEEELKLCEISYTLLEEKLNA